MTGFLTGLTLWLWCFTPKHTDAVFTKSKDEIHFTYKLLCYSHSKSNKISNLSDIKIRAQRTKEGIIIGYWLVFEFKDKSSPLLLWQEKDGEQIQNLNQITNFCLGRDTKEDQEGADKCCQDGPCLCICCPNWGCWFCCIMIIVLVVIVGSILIGVLVGGLSAASSISNQL